MRLTADLINSSLSYLNPLKERELDLRGHKIPAIENLGVAKDHDALDLTDNDILHFSNFPLMPRLHTVLLGRNRITAIQPTLPKAIPNVTTLVLSSNRLAELADLDPLGGFARLTHLVILDNPVTSKEHYRAWVVWRCPGVRFLDYKKVKDAERRHSAELLGSASAPTALAERIMGRKTATRTFDVPDEISALDGLSRANGSAVGIAADKTAVKAQLTPAERRRVQQMIRDAKSPAEIARIEKDLSEGRVPAGAEGADEDEDTAMEG